MKKVIAIIALVIVLGVGIWFFFGRNTERPGDDAYLALYEQLMDLIIEEGQNLNVDAKYIAVDIESFDLIDEYAVGIIGHLNSYNDEVFVSTYDELKANGYVDEYDNLEGILISTNVTKINEYGNKLEIEVHKYRSSLGSNSILCKAEFKNSQWKIEKKGASVS